MLAEAWNRFAESSIKSGAESRELLRGTCEEIYFLLSNRKFSFYESQPCHCSLANKALAGDREKLIAGSRENLRRLFERKPLERRVEMGGYSAFRASLMDEDPVLGKLGLCLNE